MPGTTIETLDFNLIMYEITMPDDTIEYDMEINWKPAGAFYGITDMGVEGEIDPQAPSNVRIPSIQLNHLTTIARDSWEIHEVVGNEEAATVCKIHLTVEIDESRSTEPEGNYFPPRIYLGNLPLGKGPGESDGIEVTISTMGPDGKPDKQGTKTRGVATALGGSRGEPDSSQ